MHAIEATHDLRELEVVIERGLATFVDVGVALLHIRDRRLYHETHATFEEYCRERWGFTRERGRLLMRAAEVVAELPTIVGIAPPQNEAQARELARLPAEQRGEVWQASVDAHGERVTAADVRHTAWQHTSSPKYPPWRTRRRRPNRV